MGLDLLHVAEAVKALSREVGTYISTQRVENDQIDFKSLNNLVSFVDKEAESRFVSGLREILPEAGFIAEEGSAGNNNEKYLWVIDPLDGTTNFLHNVPVFCTSVALLENRKPVIGVIFDPSADELFHAVRNQGAFLNDKPIQVSQSTALSESLLATGFPYDDFGRQQPYMKLFADLCKSTRGLRRLGSAAIDLAWVACGRFDLFYEYGLNPWDVAAGVILVEEAGGRCTGFNSEDDAVFGDDIHASNGHVHDEMTAKIHAYFPE